MSIVSDRLASPPEAARAAARPRRSSVLRPFSRIPPRVVLIGASTGGPEALTVLIARLDAVIAAAPVLITQHLLEGFAPAFAERLSRASKGATSEARDGDAVQAGRIYLAPDGHHMRVARRNGKVTIALDAEPPVNFCRPAIDPLFSSAAAIFGPQTLGVVLTGMGRDGLDGARAIVEVGGSVIAQDQHTSVVWGMPGAVAEAGLCSAILPLDQIAGAITRLFPGRAA